MASVTAFFRRKIVPGPELAAPEDLAVSMDENAYAPDLSPPPEEPRAVAHRLAGATVLLILPALSDDIANRAALNITLALLRAGARAIVAAGGGPLVSELRVLGIEWRQIHGTDTNWINLWRNARKIRDIIAAERVDIVHAQNAGAAYSAWTAMAQNPLPFVTTLPDVPASPPRFGKKYFAAPTRGRRIIAHSAYAAAPMIERYGIPKNLVTVIPYGIDTITYHPARARPDRVAALRASWQVTPGERVVLSPGPLTAENSHAHVIDAARLLFSNGLQNAVFSIPGDHRGAKRDFNALAKHAKAQGVDTLVCLGGGAEYDEATVLAAADIVVLPATAPPLYGWLAAKAQAMARPLIVPAIGVLPERLLAPPRMPDELRTGWLVKPDDPLDLARAIGTALALDDNALRAIGGRAWQFAHSTFSPASVAAAMLAVYTSLLESGHEPERAGSSQ
jgi:glycosyltransferase involved in cell wall biosynthesis